MAVKQKKLTDQGTQFQPVQCGKSSLYCERPYNGQGYDFAAGLL